MEAFDLLPLSPTSSMLELLLFSEQKIHYRWRDLGLWPWTHELSYQRRPQELSQMPHAERHELLFSCPVFSTHPETINISKFFHLYVMEIFPEASQESLEKISGY
jgi:hypothetical protein